MCPCVQNTPVVDSGATHITSVRHSPFPASVQAAGSGAQGTAEGNCRMKPRVYYTASLFNEAEREFNRRVVAMIHELGYSTWFPQEDVGVLTDLMEEKGMSLPEVRDYIFDLNIKEVQEADIVVFVLDGRVPDEGACIEAGIAWAMRKHI